MTAIAASIDSEGRRPTALLPWKQLSLISVYWFGINAVWGAYEGFGQKQMELIAGRDSITVMGVLELLGGMVAILTVPTIGAISDYTTSRFGKRKGYIITGTTLDLIFISGLSLIAMAQPADWDGSALGSAEVLILTRCCSWACSSAPTSRRGPTRASCLTWWRNARWVSPAAWSVSCARPAS